MSANENLLTTPLNALHLELGARMVPFAGYSMPVQYPAGLVAEHHHTRNAAGLFDVSHMGQLRLVGADAAAAFVAQGKAVAADLALQEGKVTGDQLRHPRDAALVDEIAGILAKTTSKGNSYLPNGRVTGNLSYESHQWLLTQAKLRKAGHDKDESS